MFFVHWQARLANIEFTYQRLQSNGEAFYTAAYVSVIWLLFPLLEKIILSKNNLP